MELISARRPADLAALREFSTAYLDHILIYSASLKEHKTHVRRVLEVLSQNCLHLKPEKCEFHKTSVHYLGLIITKEGITMDSAKIKAIVDCEDLVDLHDVCAF